MAAGMRTVAAITLANELYLLTIAIGICLSSHYLFSLHRIHNVAAGYCYRWQGVVYVSVRV